MVETSLPNLRAGEKGAEDSMSILPAFRGQVLSNRPLISDESGLGVEGGTSNAVDSKDALLFRFDYPVIVESAAIVVGKSGACGGFYQVGNDAPMAIYCIDADNDAQDQRGLLSDIGVLNAGETLRLDSSPHFGVETAGTWRLKSLSVRKLK